MQVTPATTQIESGSPESWDAARGYAGLLGAIPASFGSALRGLITDQEKGGTLTAVTRYNVLRLLKSRNLKAPYYFAVLTYQPETIKDKIFVSDEELLKLFRPVDVAVIFGLIYLYKKAKRLCDSEEWKLIEPSLLNNAEIGGHVGVALSRVGMAGGLFTSTLRHIALATFLRHNKKHFTEHRRILKSSGSLFNLNLQAGAWGCTDLQISSIFLQSLGFGVDYSNSFTSSLISETLLDRTEQKTSVFKVADIWIKALLETGAIPNIIHDITYHPNKQQIDNLMARVSEFRSNSIKHNWLDKGKDDMTPALTPQLFEGGIDKETSNQDKNEAEETVDA